MYINIMVMYTYMCVFIYIIFCVWLQKMADAMRV